MTLTGLAELPEWAFLTPRKEMQITEDGSRKVLPFVRAEQDVVILEPIAADGMKKSDWTGTADALRGICRLPGGAEFRMESSSARTAETGVENASFCRPSSEGEAALDRTHVQSRDEGTQSCVPDGVE